MSQTTNDYLILQHYRERSKRLELPGPLPPRSRRLLAALAAVNLNDHHMSKRGIPFTKPEFIRVVGRASGPFTSLATTRHAYNSLVTGVQHSIAYREGMSLLATLRNTN